MKVINKIKKFLSDPPFLFLAFTSFVALAGLIGTAVILTAFSEYVVLGYTLLGIGGIALGYSIYGFVKINGRLEAKILKWAEKREFWNNLFTRYGFRTIIATICSFAINIAFALYNGLIAIGIIITIDINSLDAIWFGALAVYYILLIIMRGIIILYHRKRWKALQNGQDQNQTYLRDLKVYGICGIFLTLLPIALSFAIMQMVGEDYAFVHSGMAIYIYAIYAFYKIITSVINFLKARKTDEMTLKAMRNINLADAMVSILALQTAMFREFNQNGQGINSAVMNGATGAVVCALTAIMGIFMIVNMYRKRKNK